MGMDQLTVLILTWNEANNIERTLRAIPWAHNILIVDSCSTDDTRELAERFPAVSVIEKPFENHADQWNFGLDHVSTVWVLVLDADYILPQESEAAIEHAMHSSAWGFQARFEYMVSGRSVRGSILPPRTVLFRVEGARYYNDGHTQRLIKAGPCEYLELTILHDDRKPLERWLQSQIKYAQLEAEMLLSRPSAALSRNDRIRKTIVLAPLLVFLLVYVLRGGFLSGWRGLFYALQRCTAEILLSLFLIDARLRQNSHARVDIAEGN